MLEKMARLVGPVRARRSWPWWPHRLLDEGQGHPLRGREGALDATAPRRSKQALVKKYNFDPNKFTVEGKGWDEPANADDPKNHALNRRVEISVYPPEAK